MLLTPFPIVDAKPVKWMEGCRRLKGPPWPAVLYLQCGPEKERVGDADISDGEAVTAQERPPVLDTQPRQFSLHCDPGERRHPCQQGRNKHTIPGGSA